MENIYNKLLDNKNITRNPIINMSRIVDDIVGKPELYDFYIREINSGYGYSPTNEISDVTQYAKPIDKRTVKATKDFASGLGNYFQRVINAYDGLRDASGNAFNRPGNPIVNRSSILRGTSTVPTGFAAQELMIGYPTLGQLSKSILGSGINFVNRVSPYLMIYEGLNQPVANQQQEWDAYNQWQLQNTDTPVLQGGVQYYD